MIINDERGENIKKWVANSGERRLGVKEECEKIEKCGEIMNEKTEM